MAYCGSLGQVHSNVPSVSVGEAGLFIDTDNFFVGASPDGIISCDCCGRGVLEVKCPLCVKDTSILDAAAKNDFCLGTTNSTVSLKKGHKYYYQVQAQIFVTNANFCDFIIWTPNEIFIERILPDHHFWQSNLARVRTFYIHGVLPELLGRYYTRMHVCDATLARTPTVDRPCYCKEYKSDTVLTCASTTCAVKYFHKQCLGLKNKPRKGWQCLDCRAVKKQGSKV